MGGALCTDPRTIADALEPEVELSKKTEIHI